MSLARRPLVKTWMLVVLLAFVLVVAVAGVALLLSNQSPNSKLPPEVTVSGSVSIRPETITSYGYNTVFSSTSTYVSTVTFSPSLVSFACDESTGCNSSSPIDVSGSFVSGVYSVTLPNNHDYHVSVIDASGSYYICGTVYVNSQSPSFSYDVSC